MIEYSHDSKNEVLKFKISKDVIALLLGCLSGLFSGYNFGTSSSNPTEVSAPIVLHLPTGLEHDRVKIDSVVFLTSLEIGHNFHVESVVFHDGTSTMSDVHYDLVSGVLDWQPSPTVKGSINLYILSDDCLESCFHVAGGIAPSLYPSDWRFYKSGYLEDIVIRLDNLYSLKTWIHEFGHFFGLGHRWKCLNWMNYEKCASQFDDDQRDTMNIVINHYKKYLFR